MGLGNRYNQAIANTVEAFSLGNYVEIYNNLEIANEEFDKASDEASDGEILFLAMLNHDLTDYLRALDLCLKVQDRSIVGFEDFLGQVYFATGEIGEILDCYSSTVSEYNPGSQQSEYAGEMIVKILVEFGGFPSVDGFQKSVEAMGLPNIEDDGGDLIAKL